MGGNSNVQIQARFVSAVFSGNADTIRELTDPNFELREGSGLPFSGLYSGADGFLNFLKIFNETLEIELLEPIRIYETQDPDWIASEFNLHSTLRATGEPFKSTLVEIWNFKDGKVASIIPHYFNKV